MDKEKIVFFRKTQINIVIGRGRNMKLSTNTSAQLKKVAGIPLETELYLSISKPYKMSSLK
jgi:hypothetical protein